MAVVARSSAPGPPPMCFTGSSIDRSAALLKQKTRGFFAECLAAPSTRFLLLHRGAALCRCCEAPSGVLTPWWLTLDQLLSAGVRLELPPDVTGPTLAGHDLAAVAGSAVTVLLGHVSAEADDGGGPGWRVAVEWGRHTEAEAEALRQVVVAAEASVTSSWCGGRELYHKLAWTDAAAVGHAVCATGWQLKALHCGVSGQATVPIEAGAKRRSVDGSSRIYPRIDPCCIMLVVSADRTRCLLSHPARLRAGVWTCLAGFIDSCESVEEAVRRETMEEAGIVVGDVELALSQPWPLGRGGAELMIACKAVAHSSEIAVGDTEEYANSDDVRWFTRAEAKDMLAAARVAYTYKAPFAQQQRQQQQQQAQAPVEGAAAGGREDKDHTAPHPYDPQALLTPGPYAVAYHLIKDWTDEVQTSGPAKPEIPAAAAPVSASTATAALGREEQEEVVVVATAALIGGWAFSAGAGEAACLFISGAAAATAVSSWVHRR